MNSDVTATRVRISAKPIHETRTMTHATPHHTPIRPNVEYGVCGGQLSHGVPRLWVCSGLLTCPRPIFLFHLGRGQVPEHTP